MTSALNNDGTSKIIPCKGKDANRPVEPFRALISFMHQSIKTAHCAFRFTPCFTWWSWKLDSASSLVSLSLSHLCELCLFPSVSFVSSSPHPLCERCPHLVFVHVHCVLISLLLFESYDCLLALSVTCVVISLYLCKWCPILFSLSVLCVLISLYLCAW